MEETNYLENCLSWMNEGEKTEFLMCVGDYHLSFVTEHKFDITKYRSTIKALIYLYMKQTEDSHFL
jgi:hypothetical protein